jgi:hypothetical protein
VGPKYAAMLNKIGINDVQELADQNAVALRRQITSFLNTTDGKKITSRRPSLATVKKWIQGSKALPRMMKQLGDTGPDFDKAAFDKLPQYQQHMLLMGWDVRVNSGFIFDDAQLEVSQVQRKPRALGDAIKELENSAFGGDYESADLSSVERLKVGDELIGYRATFDVVAEGELDSELAGLTGDERMRGTVDVTFDENGKVLGQESYLDYDYSHE